MQIFSDKDTKLVSGYVGSGQTNEAKGAPKAKLETEKVIVTTGSAAGAGSGEFDLYRAARNRERDRVEKLDAQLRKEAEEEVFAQKVNRNKREAEERTEKNRLKRMKKKKQKLANKKVAAASSSNHSDDDSSDEDDNVVPSSKDSEPVVSAVRAQEEEKT